MWVSGTHVAAVLGGVLALGGCGLCGSQDRVAVPSPDGRHVAYSYLWSCGATTGYVTHVDLGRRGDTDGVTVYLLKGAHDVELRWASPRELHIQCRACSPRHPMAPPVDGVTVKAVQSQADHERPRLRPQSPAARRRRVPAGGGRAAITARDKARPYLDWGGPCT